MRMFVWAASLAVITSGVVPAEGQSIVDTFNRLRSTLKQAGVGRASQPGPSSTVRGGPAAPAGVGDAMVPPSILTDDRSDTALADAPLVRGRIVTFDLRGLKLGMSPREVGRVAAREGFARRWNDTILTSGTFEAEATELANQRLAHPLQHGAERVLRSTQAVDSAGDMLECKFTIEPQGPRLSNVVYTARLNGTTEAQAIDALKAKYGQPSKVEPAFDVVSWFGTRRPVDDSSPTLYVVVRDGGMTATLAQSTDYGLEARRVLQERAKDIAAARGGGVRF